MGDQIRMALFDEYHIADEKAMDFSVSLLESNDRVPFNYKSEFVALEFMVFYVHSTGQRYITIRDVGTVPPGGSNTYAAVTQTDDELLAQIILWKWDQGKQTIQKTIVMKKGGQIEESAHSKSVSIVIRILMKRQVIENPCPPLSSPDDDLTVHIGDRQLTVSAHWLMDMSPMVRRMLSVDMREKQQRVLKLDGHGISMEQFIEFMDAISAASVRQPFFPNPQNVLRFLWFADYLQIDWLRERCGVHLANCLEIPFADRFLLIERYKLPNLMQHFLLLLKEATTNK